MEKLGGVGFSFAPLERHGVQFITACPTTITLETLDDLIALCQRLEMPVSIDGNRIMVIDPT